jgi:hypothetical protein
MILLFGNCQLQRMSFICGLNDIKCSYVANTERVDPEFNVDEVLQTVSEADVVIAQPIFNELSPLNHEVISRTAKSVKFFPYVFIDGIFSLSALATGSPHVLGQQYLAGHDEDSLHRLIVDFHLGLIDFKNQERFESSLKELERREKAVDCLPISDVIGENYKKRKLMLTHNHPEKWLMNVMCERLFKEMNWSYRNYDDSTHHQRVDYMFDAGETVLSPYDVDRMGLHFASDDQWFGSGWRLLNRIWADKHPVVAN